MEGLCWLERNDRRILYVDYTSIKNPLRLLHAARKEQHQAEGSCIYNMINLGFNNYSESFIKEYIETIQEILKQKKLIAAFRKATPEVKKRIAEVMRQLSNKNCPTIEFFETEPAALDWLFSFQNCEN